MRKRLLLGASWSVIENLGIMHIGGLAKSLGWEVFYCQPKNHDFTEFQERVDDIKPDVVGYNVYTGAHIQLKGMLKELKRRHPEVRTVIGGPHATYFPQELISCADNVVMSEGFNAFRRILNGEVGPGIIEFFDENMERFSMPDRKGYYRDSPDHKKSRIKSIIGMSGCPYNCTYCNNSDTGAVVVVPENLRPLTTDRRLIPLEVLASSCADKKTRRKGSRAFPRNVRPTEDIIAEAREVMEISPETQMFYHQDDVWLQKSGEGELHYILAHRWRNEIGVPCHGQMRWEMLRGESGDKRLDLAQQMGATGLTLAIESADPVIRDEVLSRNMPQEIMYEGTEKIAKRGMTLRTEQITALPAGATTRKTKINLDLDLETLELNVDLHERYGIPTISWASTHAPYAGTGIVLYMIRRGFYNGDDSNVPEEFFDRSVARFLKRYVGPELEHLKDDPHADVWLSHDALERYRDQNATLRAHWNTFALTPRGHVLARRLLESSEPLTYERLGRETEQHLIELRAKGNQRAQEILERIDGIRRAEFQGLNGDPGDSRITSDIKTLAPYLAVLPRVESIIQCVIDHAKDPHFRRKAAARGGAQEGLDAYTLSTGIRRGLYESALYKLGYNGNGRVHMPERYPAKV